MSKVETIGHEAPLIDDGSPLPLPNVEVRAASLGDAGILAEIGAATFRSTYALSNDPEDLNAYIADHFTPSRVRWEMMTEGGRFYLAFGPDGIVGYAKTRRPAPPDRVGEGYLEMQRLYVLSACRGAGVGGALLRRALRDAIREGLPGMWLGVDQANSAAIAFYRHFGFEIAGHKTFVLGASVHPDFVMARSLRYAIDEPRPGSWPRASGVPRMRFLSQRLGEGTS